jgi:hypothetical protein
LCFSFRSTTFHDSLVRIRLFVGIQLRLGASPIEAIDRCGLAGFLRVLFFFHAIMNAMRKTLFSIDQCIGLHTTRLSPRIYL